MFSKLDSVGLLIEKYLRHNSYAIFAKYLNICKYVAGNLSAASRNVPRRGVVPLCAHKENHGKTEVFKIILLILR